MDTEAYIEQRLEEQMSWYDRAARRSMVFYYVLTIGAAIGSGTVPIVVAFDQAQIGAVLGGAASVLTASVAIMKSQENWIRYRSTWNTLGSERFQYRTRTGPYLGRDGEQARALFVDRVEGILTNEYQTWQQSWEASKEGQKANPT